MQQEDKVIYEKLQSALPLPPLPQRLSAEAVAGRLAGKAPKRARPAISVVRRTLAAAAVLALVLLAAAKLPVFFTGGLQQMAGEGAAPQSAMHSEATDVENGALFEDRAGDSCPFGVLTLQSGAQCRVLLGGSADDYRITRQPEALALSLAEGQEGAELVVQALAPTEEAVVVELVSAGGETHSFQILVN